MLSLPRAGVFIVFTNGPWSKSMLEVLLPVHGPEAQLSSSELCSNTAGSGSMDSEEAPQLAMEATGLPGGGPLFTIEVTEFAIEATLPLLAMETTGLPRAGPVFRGCQGLAHCSRAAKGWQWKPQGWVVSGSFWASSTSGLCSNKDGSNSLATHWDADQLVIGPIPGLARGITIVCVASATMLFHRNLRTP